jgi:hypothetical protein
VLLALLTPALAADCRDTLSVRPVDRQVDVPVDAWVRVSLIGWGTADEVAVGLTDDAGSELSVTTETGCYEHEGPHEVHCWHLLSPASPMAADTAHSVVLQSTTAWTGSGQLSQASSFTIGSALAVATAGPPTLILDRRTDVESPETCEYPEPRQHWLTLAAAELVQQDLEVKQWLDGGATIDDCYQVTHEDAGGRLTPGAAACWQTDTGPLDTAGGTGHSDSGPGDM